MIISKNLGIIPITRVTGRGEERHEVDTVILEVRTSCIHTTTHTHEKNTQIIS